jgi:REP element-mobilizing transposase RayT
MPDHLHALLSFPPSEKPIRLFISKWKEWTARTVGIQWQDDFFEHRLRHDESRRQKADYILENRSRTGIKLAPASATAPNHKTEEARTGRRASISIKFFGEQRF